VGPLSAQHPGTLAANRRFLGGALLSFWLPHVAIFALTSALAAAGLAVGASASAAFPAAVLVGWAWGFGRRARRQRAALAALRELLGKDEAEPALDWLEQALGVHADPDAAARKQVRRRFVWPHGDVDYALLRGLLLFAWGDDRGAERSVACVDWSDRPPLVNSRRHSLSVRVALVSGDLPTARSELAAFEALAPLPRWPWLRTMRLGHQTLADFVAAFEGDPEARLRLAVVREDLHPADAALAAWVLARCAQNEAEAETWRHVAREELPRVRVPRTSFPERQFPPLEPMRTLRTGRRGWWGCLLPAVAIGFLTLALLLLALLALGSTGALAPGGPIDTLF
jgi:hypothetical protein